MFNHLLKLDTGSLGKMRSLGMPQTLTGASLEITESQMGELKVKAMSVEKGWASGRVP